MQNSCDLVIFGGFGDLSLRKLLPALYRCELAGQLAQSSRIFLCSRNAMAPEQALDTIYQWLSKQLKNSEDPQQVWPAFSKRLHLIELDTQNHSPGWSQLSDTLSQQPQQCIYYFALPAKLYGPCCKQLQQQHLISDKCRLVLEKPIGYDQKSADEIHSEIAEYFSESQIYRIDHYLGKETVQNLLALRFANTLFEPQWNHQAIDHVQISLVESVGVEGRGGFYDQAGAMRDMVQNHLLQLLCLVAMEPPSRLQASSIRDEKLKVLKALRPITSDKIASHCIRGQYTSGFANGQAVPGYVEELDQDKSNTETYVAIKAHIDNWRWSGVPFYLRTGKRLQQRSAEIVIQFKPVSHSVFGADAGPLQPNKLVIRLQPNEGIQLSMMAKELDRYDMHLQSVPLNLSFADTFTNIHSDAYQRLLLNVMQGDLSLFTHRQEVDLAWAWLDPIQQAWQQQKQPLEAYQAGSWGPDAAAALLHKDGRRWMNQHPAIGDRKR